MRLKVDWASLMVRSKFTVFALLYVVFEGNFPSTSPRRGDLTEGFLRYEFGGLIFGGAYTWRSLFSEFYGNAVPSSPHTRESEFWNPGNFCLWNPRSWVLESGIHLKESGILLTIRIQNPSSTDKYWNRESTAWNSESKNVLDCFT